MQRQHSHCHMSEEEEQQEPKATEAGFKYPCRTLAMCSAPPATSCNT